MGRPWSGSFFGENGGPLKAELTKEGTIPAETFEKGCCRTVEQALEVARRIGYEDGIMIKASEGGGGKGIRLVYKEEDLPDMFLQVQNEVIGSPIFLMQLCKNNRHIEIQIVGDEHGHACAFSGRDCSTQRRFQKICKYTYDATRNHWLAILFGTLNKVFSFSFILIGS